MAVFLYIQCIELNKGGPVGIETLAAALSEAKDTLEEVVEPYLLQQGLLQRTARGRILTDQALRIMHEEGIASSNQTKL